MRSWTRQVALVAKVESADGQIRIVEIQGVFHSEDETPGFTAHNFDFLLRSHVLALPYPALLPPGMAQDPVAAASWSFSLFGNCVAFASAVPIERDLPGAVLRSHSSLHIAIARGDVAAVHAALAAGIAPDLLAGDGLAPLHWALVKMDMDVMELLLARGSSIDVRSAQGATPLMNAVQKSDLVAVSFMLRHGADVNAADQRGFTALHRAAEMGLIDVARELLAAGASPEIEAEGHSPRTFAEQRGLPEMVELLMHATPR